MKHQGQKSDQANYPKLISQHTITSKLLVGKLMGKEEKKYREELDRYRELLNRTQQQQEKKGLKPYSHPDHYDRLCAKEDNTT